MGVTGHDGSGSEFRQTYETLEIPHSVNHSGILEGNTIFSLNCKIRPTWDTGRGTPENTRLSLIRKQSEILEGGTPDSHLIAKSNQSGILEGRAPDSQLITKSNQVGYWRGNTRLSLIRKFN